MGKGLRCPRQTCNTRDLPNDPWQRRHQVDPFALLIPEHSVALGIRTKAYLLFPFPGRSAVKVKQEIHEEQTEAPEETASP